MTLGKCSKCFSGSYASRLYYFPVKIDTVIPWFNPNIIRVALLKMNSKQTRHLRKNVEIATFINADRKPATTI